MKQHLTQHPLKKILELTQDQWDHPAERAAVRDNFRKVCMCRTPALGGEVYASAAGEKVFYHTCKSKCCPSCGNRGTLLWQREQWATLPDIPVRRHRPHHARCLLAGLQGPSASAARSAGPGCRRAPAVGVDPIPGTPVRDRHTTHLRRPSQPSSAPPHHGLCRRTESSRSPLGAITGV